MNSIKIKVTGKVQGVAFRYHTKQKADDLGLSGSVENLEDGSVLIYAFGEHTKIDTLLTWCHTGSPAAKVIDVISSHTAQQKESTGVGFVILR